MSNYDNWKLRSDMDDNPQHGEPPVDGPDELELVYEQLHALQKEHGHLLGAALTFANAYDRWRDPGTSDLDGDQPVSITMRLGDWRRLSLATRRAQRSEA